MREITLFGTSWPLPDDVVEESPGRFIGAAGLAEILVEEGDLIDPARCAGANARGDVQWQLVRCRNGVALAGTLREEGTCSLVYVLRADVADIDGAAFDWPEVVATYVLVRPDDVEAIRSALEVRVIDPKDYGELDGPGYACVGPVPMVRDWLPPGATDAVRPLKEVETWVVGGGFMYFTHPSGCSCCMNLMPLQWRTLDLRRLEVFLDAAVHDSGMGYDFHCTRHAGVWRCSIGAGVSFNMTGSDGEERVGAAWTDAFGQVWFLEYRVCAEHGPELLPALEAVEP